MVDTKARFTKFEHDVIQHILNGTGQFTVELMRQFASSLVIRREHTGVGLYVYIRCVDSAVPITERRLLLQATDLNVKGVEHGVCAFLWIDEGLLSCLEIVTYAEDFPQEVDSYSFNDVSPSGRGGGGSV